MLAFEQTARAFPNKLRSATSTLALSVQSRHNPRPKNFRRQATNEKQSHERGPIPRPPPKSPAENHQGSPPRQLDLRRGRKGGPAPEESRGLREVLRNRWSPRYRAEHRR